MKCLVLFLASLTLLSCDKNCPEKPKTPPGWVCGELKNFAGGVYPSQRYIVPIGIAFAVRTRDGHYCQIWHEGVLDVEKVEGRMVKAKLSAPPDPIRAPRPADACRWGEDVVATIFDFANMAMPTEELSAGRRMLEAQ